MKEAKIKVHKKDTGGPVTSRPYKSRTQRPCDFCRKRKSCCMIEGALPCKLCRQFNKGQCTFNDGPIARNRNPTTRRRNNNKENKQPSGNTKQDSVELVKTPNPQDVSMRRHIVAFKLEQQTGSIVLTSDLPKSYMTDPLNRPQGKDDLNYYTGQPELINLGNMNMPDHLTNELVSGPKDLDNFANLPMKMSSVYTPNIGMAPNFDNLAMMGRNGMDHNRAFMGEMELEKMDNSDSPSNGSYSESRNHSLSMANGGNSELIYPNVAVPQKKEPFEKIISDKDLEFIRSYTSDVHYDGNSNGQGFANSGLNRKSSNLDRLTSMEKSIFEVSYKYMTSKYIVSSANQVFTITKWKNTKLEKIGYAVQLDEESVRRRSKINDRGNTTLFQLLNVRLVMKLLGFFIERVNPSFPILSIDQCELITVLNDIYDQTMNSPIVENSPVHLLIKEKLNENFPPELLSMAVISSLRVHREQSDILHPLPLREFDLEKIESVLLDNVHKTLHMSHLELGGSWNSNGYHKLQTLLLLTSHVCYNSVSSPNEQLDNYLQIREYISESLLLANSMGLNNNSEDWLLTSNDQIETIKLSAKENMWRRKLWWCLYLQEKIVCVGFGLKSEIVNLWDIPSNNSSDGNTNTNFSSSLLFQSLTDIALLLEELTNFEARDHEIMNSKNSSRSMAGFINLESYNQYYLNFHYDLLKRLNDVKSGLKRSCLFKSTRLRIYQALLRNLLLTCTDFSQTNGKLTEAIKAAVSSLKEPGLSQELRINLIGTASPLSDLLEFAGHYLPCQLTGFCEELRTSYTHLAQDQAFKDFIGEIEAIANN